MPAVGAARTPEHAAVAIAVLALVFLGLAARIRRRSAR